MDLISIVIPCYNEEDVLFNFYDEITKVYKSMKKQYKTEFEYIFINDGSTDKTLSKLQNLCSLDKKARYVSFSRNFGKESALFAGMEKAKGDYIVFIDADLQHDPKKLDEMYHAIKFKNYDSAATRRISRKGEPFIRSFLSKQFYKVMKLISNVNVVDGAQDYRMMTRQMLNEILRLQEYNRFSKGIFSWIGFDTKYIEVENTERVSGDTKWSFTSLVKYSIEAICSFSTVPLVLSFALSMGLVLLSVIIVIATVIKALIWGDPVAGFPTLICAIFFIGGVQLFCIGILGQYLAKTYLETKGRPIYVVKEENKNLGTIEDKGNDFDKKD